MRWSLFCEFLGRAQFLQFAEFFFQRTDVKHRACLPLLSRGSHETNTDFHLI